MIPLLKCAAQSPEVHVKIQILMTQSQRFSVGRAGVAFGIWVYMSTPSNPNVGSMQTTHRNTGSVTDWKAT